MKPALLLVFLLVGPAPARWETTKSDNGGLVARWTTNIRLDTILVHGRTTLRPALDGAHYSGETGAPGMPYVSALIAVPNGMKAVASATSGPVNVYDGWLSPMPDTALREDRLGYRPVYAIRREAYALPRAESRLRLEEAGVAEGVRLMRVVLAPVRFDPAVRRIEIARSITVTVTFTGAAPPMVRRPALPRFWSDAVLNADRVRFWGKPARRARPASGTGFFEHGTWMRVMVSTPAIHYLTASSVIAVDERFRDAPLDHVGMFGGPGRELPINPTTKRPKNFQIVRPIVIDANGDGKFNGNDSLLFYGKGPSGWHQHMGGLYETSYETDRYTRENVYWLAILDTLAQHAEVREGTVTAPNAPEITRYYFREHEETEQFNFDENGGVESDGSASGLDWAWEQLTPQASRTIRPTLYNMAGDTVVFRIGQLMQGGRFYNLTASIGGKPTPSYESAMTSTFGVYQAFQQVVPAGDQVSLPITIQNPTLSNPNGSTENSAFLDYYELFYWRRLAVRGGSLAFTLAPFREVAPDRPAQLLLTGVDRAVQRLFDVTDSVGLIEYRLPPADGDGITRVQVSRSGLLERRFLLTSRSEWRPPARLEAATPTANLRGRSGGVDYLIISHPDFVREAQRLAQWRGEYDHFRTAVVSTRDIYDEFSFGMFDPAAIRDFLKYASENWRDGPTDSGLKYVLLLGDGQYDFRNIQRFYQNENDPHPGNWVPTYQEGDITTDDWFGAFGSGPIPSLRIGRLCVQTVDEARQVVDKIIAYEKEPERGSWQNRVIMVADDEFNSDYGFNWETMFVRDSETLLPMFRAETVVDKIYSFRYPMNEQRLRPGANRAITDAWSDGAILINYIGHGSPVGWAHERIFMLNDDLPNIRNGKRLPILTALTCSAGHFDDPGRQSMAEVLTNLPHNGVIASVAATRLVFNSDNVTFNRGFLTELFHGENTRPRIGDAFGAAKALALASSSAGYRHNSRKFALIGDPAMRVALPELHVRVAVNGDSLSALQPVTLRGTVLTGEGNDVLTSFDGTALVQLFDSETPGIFRAESGRTVPFQRTGETMFRGIAPASKGEFSIEAILPREVVYGGTEARAVVQVWNDQIDGAGSREGLAIRASLEPSASDTEGPTILFTRADDPVEAGKREPLVDGTTIAPNEDIRVWLSDPSGINVTGSIGHRLLAYFDDKRDTPIDFTSRFVHWASATSGWADIALSGGTAPRRLVVEAWDNRNNFATDSVFIRVGKAAGMTLANVIAYPNPMSDETTFTWIAAGIGNDTRADATVRIFTIAGRLVDTVTLSDIVDGPVLLPWRPPRPLANGVYLYEISIRRRSDGSTTRAIERVAVVSP